MDRRLVAPLAFALLLTAPIDRDLQAQQPVADQYRAVANRIIDAAIADSSGAWTRLAAFVDYSGSRLSGSVNLERGIDWVLAEMKKDGLANVRGEPVMVPHWVRGRESLTLVLPRAGRRADARLGGSIGTPAAGITAEVLVVESYDELTKRAAAGEGQDRPLRRALHDYGADRAVPRRWRLGRGEGRRRRRTAPLGRPLRHAHAAHRRHALRLHRHEDPLRRDPDGGRHDVPPHAGAR